MDSNSLSIIFFFPAVSAVPSDIPEQSEKNQPPEILPKAD
jgi:hypothetical protein